MKQGRNDPCGCGSGKKFKKCCMMDYADKKAMYMRDLGQMEFVRDVYDESLGGWHDVYAVPGEKGGMMMLIPSLREGMHSEVLRLVKMRRKANLTGTCPSCGEVVSFDVDGPRIRHEPDCEVIGNGLADAVKRYGPSAMSMDGRRLDDTEVA